MSPIRFEGCGIDRVAQPGSTGINKDGNQEDLDKPSLNVKQVMPRQRKLDLPYQLQMQHTSPTPHQRTYLLYSVDQPKKVRKEDIQ